MSLTIRKPLVDVALGLERVNVIGFGLGLGLSLERTRMGTTARLVKDAFARVSDVTWVAKISLGPRSLCLRVSIYRLVKES